MLDGFQLRRERFGVSEFVQCRVEGLRSGHAAADELVVALLEMIVQLPDDLFLAAGRQPQTCESFCNLLREIRHVRAP